MQQQNNNDRNDDDCNTVQFINKRVKNRDNQNREKSETEKRYFADLPQDNRVRQIVLCVISQYDAAVVSLEKDEVSDAKWVLVFASLFNTHFNNVSLNDIQQAIEYLTQKSAQHKHNLPCLSKFLPYLQVFADAKRSNDNIFSSAVQILDYVESLKGNKDEYDFAINKFEGYINGVDKAQKELMQNNNAFTQSMIKDMKHPATNVLINLRYDFSSQEKKTNFFKKPVQQQLQQQFQNLNISQNQNNRQQQQFSNSQIQIQDKIQEPQINVNQFSKTMNLGNQIQQQSNQQINVRQNRQNQQIIQQQPKDWSQISQNFTDTLLFVVEGGVSGDVSLSKSFPRIPNGYFQDQNKNEIKPEHKMMYDALCNAQSLVMNSMRLAFQKIESVREFIVENKVDLYAIVQNAEGRIGLDPNKQQERTERFNVFKDALHALTGLTYDDLKSYQNPSSECKKAIENKINQAKNQNQNQQQQRLF